MRKIAALSLALLLVAGLAAASSVSAEQERSGPGMDRGMMENGGMTGMMNMMKRMGRMMDHCSGMMNDGGNRPNDQWRRKAPSEPEQ